MKKLATIGFVFCLLWSTNAGAQAIVNGGLSGTIVSADVAVPPGTTVTLYTVPESGHFALTEVGSPNIPPGQIVRITVTSFGEIAGFMGAGPPQPIRSEIAPPSPPRSQVFTPGLALPQGATIQCVSELGRAMGREGGEPSDCWMTGVLESE